MKSITSRENPFFKQLVKLEESARQRRTSGLTLLDGAHLINAYHAALGLPESLIVGESGCESAEIKRLLTRLEGSLSNGTRSKLLHELIAKHVAINRIIIFFIFINLLLL